MKIKELIKNILGIKIDIPSYPPEFLIIDFSLIAKNKGIRDEQNKVIYRYVYNNFLDKIILKEKYRYSLERLKSLVEVYNLPFYDKTIIGDILPMYEKIYLSEAEYSI
ncbi:MAG: hypothetical protein KKB31_05745 [Nanoarchaeota archaeon]|nr:hypothetical protein [Nanoarchaeota archaeon]